MPNYRRRFSPGGTFFFTVMVAEGSGISLIDNLALLRRCYAATLAEHPFQTLAIVILPDHLHAVWKLPDGDANYPLRWRKLKGRFSHVLNRAPSLRPSQMARRESGIWQRRYWEHQITDRDDLALHLSYCWSDPVRHGLAKTPASWDASSIHREVRHGRLPADWSCGPIAGDFGERQRSLATQA